MSEDEPSAKSPGIETIETSKATAVAASDTNEKEEQTTQNVPIKEKEEGQEAQPEVVATSPNNNEQLNHKQYSPTNRRQHTNHRKHNHHHHHHNHQQHNHHHQSSQSSTSVASSADVSQQAPPPSASSQPVSADYLAQLIKDKKQLAAFPSTVFLHLPRLVEEEIVKVRASLFQLQDVVNLQEPLILPEPEGEFVSMQEKIYVPIGEHPEYNFVGRLLGPRGMTAKQLEQETGCKIMIRGKGSMRDKKKVSLLNSS